MWISDTSIRRPVTTITLMGALVIFGWIAFRGMGIDAFPNVELPTVTVRTILVGASPDVIDQDVTDPLEEQIKAIAGIKTLTSQSFEGISFIRSSSTSGRTSTTPPPRSAPRPTSRGSSYPTT